MKMDKSMKQALTDIITGIWDEQCDRIRLMVTEAHKQCLELLKLEDYYRHGHKDEDRLERSLGGFGGSLFDVNSMSTLLSKGDEKRGLSAGRYERVKDIAEGLSTVLAELEGYRPGELLRPLRQDPEENVREFEREANRFAEIFGLIRASRLEATARYEDRHDNFFANFDWRDLNDDEASCCPPHVVLIDAASNNEQVPGQILALLSSGCPLKLVLLRSGLEQLLSGKADRGRAAIMRSHFNMETLPLSLRNVYFLQSAQGADSTYVEHVTVALNSLRPAVLSLFSPPGESSELTSDEALLAVQSRCFPQIVYNPDHAADSLGALSLFENPDQKELWSTTRLASADSDSDNQEVEFRSTAADLVVRSKRDLFIELDPAAKNAIYLADYLDIPADQRERKIPFVYLRDAEGILKRYQPHLEVIVWTVEKMQIWQMLQELSGVANPYVEAATRELQATLEQDKLAELKALRSEMEGKIQQHEQSAVQSALSNLARQLTGLAGSDHLFQAATALSAAPGSPPQNPTVAPSNGAATPAVVAVEPAPQSADDLPWIESEECTSCDDCITLNSRIFAYNEDKKAVVKDPRGGPFRDIVRAAEKCPAMIIHPGQPLDPGEKDLQKWVKRAEKFQ